MWKGQVGWPISALIICLTLGYLSFSFERAFSSNVNIPSTARGMLESTIPTQNTTILPVLVLMFLTTTGLQAPDIWQAWYDDADDFIRLTRPGRRASDFLRGVVHYRKGLNESEISTPRWLKDSLDPEPTESAWGVLLPAMQRVLYRATEAHPDATYFMYISDTTVPVKAFSSIWSSIMADPRSRLDIYCHDHFNGNKKHTQWMMLSREHALVLASDDAWAHPKVNWVKGSCRTGVAASDEYWPLKAITHSESLNATWDDFWMKGGTEHDVTFLNAWTMTYWRSLNPRIAHARIGNYNIKSGHPSSFSDIQGTFLRMLVQMESMWFFRKADDNLVVKDCNASLIEYFSQLLGGDLRKDQTPYERAREDCPLKEYLPSLWRRRSEGRLEMYSSFYS